MISEEDKKNAEIQNLAGYNLYNETIFVKHSALKRYGNNSIFHSVCPVCGHGILMVTRDKMFKIIKEDHCVLCGQHYEYTDIDDLRNKALGRK